MAPVMSNRFNTLNYLGYTVKVSNLDKDIKNCSHIILPGVGAFGSAMQKSKILFL